MKEQIIKFGVTDKQGHCIIDSTLIACPDELPISLAFTSKIVGKASKPEKRADGFYLDVELTDEEAKRFRPFVFRPGGTAEKHDDKILSYKIEEVAIIRQSNDVY